LVARGTSGCATAPRKQERACEPIGLAPRSLVPSQRKHVLINGVQIQLDASGKRDSLATASGVVAPRAVSLAPKVLNAGGFLRDQQIVGQRRQATVALPLESAVVLLGAWGEHFDHDRGVLDHVFGAGLNAQLPAHDGDVCIDVARVVSEAELQIARKHFAFLPERHTKRPRDTRRQCCMPRAAARHGKDFAVKVLVPSLLLALPNEKLSGRDARRHSRLSHGRKFSTGPTSGLAHFEEEQSHSLTLRSLGQLPISLLPDGGVHLLVNRGEGPRSQHFGEAARILAMATLNISLTDELRSYVEERVSSGRYGNASEYFRDLVRGDQDRQREDDLETLLLEGLRSGDAKPLGRADFDRARAFVRELATKKQAKGK